MYSFAHREIIDGSRCDAKECSCRRGSITADNDGDKNSYKRRLWPKVPVQSKGGNFPLASFRTWGACPGMGLAGGTRIQPSLWPKQLVWSKNGLSRFGVRHEDWIPDQGPEW